MPRYFFNVLDGTNLHDDEGIDLPDLDTARFVAVRYAGALLEECGHCLGFGQTWHLEATDEARHVLFHLDFRVRPASELAAACGPASIRLLNAGTIAQSADG